MDRRLDSWVAASNLIDKHGEAAVVQAERRVRSLINSGDRDGAAIWRLVARAIDDLLGTPAERA